MKEFLIKNPVVVLIMGVFILLFTGDNFLLMHTIVETFIVGVSFSIYLLSSRSHAYTEDNFLLFWGIGQFYVAILQLLHIITYPGMEIVSVDLGTATQFWIAARYLEAFSFLAAPYFLNRELPERPVFIGYLLITGIILASIGWGVFPACYVQGTGFTTFKIASECIISIIFFGAILHIYHRRAQFHASLYRLLILTLVTAIAAEIAFILYTSPTGPMSSIAHGLKLLSTLPVFWAIVLRGIEAPFKELETTYQDTLLAWVKAMELRDQHTEGHCQRVAQLTCSLAECMGLPKKDIKSMYMGALLHDIGKIVVPDNILSKPGPLDEHERKIMERHTEYAYQFLSHLDNQRIAIDIAHYHHEKWDGTGYPMGLKGEEIPLSARIFAVADVWDALSSERPYRKSPWPDDKILTYIQEQSGKHFDPYIVDKFIELKLGDLTEKNIICEPSNLDHGQVYLS